VTSQRELSGVTNVTAEPEPLDVDDTIVQAAKTACGTEVWAPVVDFEDSYAVSDRARVMSLPRTVEVSGQVARRYTRERILRPSVRPSGREQYVLFRNGEPFVRDIQRG
jgi:hypothetical protein